jgi:hypothetical protein
MIYIYKELIFLIELTIGELNIYIYDNNTNVLYWKQYYDKWNPINNITKVSMKDVYKMMINFFENPKSRIYLEIIFDDNKLKLEFVHVTSIYDIKFDFTLYKNYYTDLFLRVCDYIVTNIDLRHFKLVDDTFHDPNKARRIKKTIIL